MVCVGYSAIFWLPFQDIMTIFCHGTYSYVGFVQKCDRTVGSCWNAIHAYMLIVIVIKFQTFYINPWVKSVQQPHFQFFISFLCRTGLKDVPMMLCVPSSIPNIRNPYGRFSRHALFEIADMRSPISSQEWKLCLNSTHSFSMDKCTTWSTIFFNSASFII